LRDFSWRKGAAVASDPLPRAVVVAIGAALRSFVDGAASALEGAVRAELPQPASTVVPPSRGPDWRSAIQKIAHHNLKPRGFELEHVDMLADQDAFRVVASHVCGSRLVVRITGRMIVAARGERAAIMAIIDAIDRAGCYCVPREVLVPCTARSCEERS
jgi:hypothetical protein